MTTQRERCAALVLLAAISTAPLGCASGRLEPELQPLAAEAPVRLTTRARVASGEWEDRVFTGRLVSLDSLSLTVRLDGTAPAEIVKVSRATILIVEVSQSSRHYLKEGALAGLGLGLAIGLGITRGSDACRATMTCSPRTDAKDNETIASYAMVGTAVGALIGYLTRTHDWTEVPMSALPRGVSTRPPAAQVLAK